MGPSFLKAQQMLRRVTRSSALGLCTLGLLGCEAELHLEDVDATKVKPIHRTDQFASLEIAGDGRLFGFADHGVIIEASADDYQQSPIKWSRTELDDAPNFIASTACEEGAVYGLSFENQLWTRDAGNWTATNVDTQEQLQAVTCTPAGDLWVSGAFSTIMRSSDGGDTWDEFSLYEDFTLTAIDFVDADTGFAVGEFGSLIKTVDGGESWEVMDPITDDFYPLAAHFDSADEGWVSGVLGLVLYTNDGGLSWQTQETATVASIYGFTRSEDALYAYGDLGALLRYEEGVWVDQPSPEIPVHYASALKLEGRMLLAGGWGVVVEVPIATAAAEPSADISASLSLSSDEEAL